MAPAELSGKAWLSRLPSQFQANGVTVVLEIKGFEDDQTKAKHNAAKRWVEAVNNWGQLGEWAFHVCRNPQLLEKELDYLLHEAQAAR